MLPSGARSWPLIAPVALIVIALFLASLGSPSIRRVAVTGTIYLVVVVSLYLFIGLSGVFSLGHIGLMAIGAYTAALLTIPVTTKATLLVDLPAVLAEAEFSSSAATIVAGGIAALVAALVSIPLMRLTGLTAGLATFAVLVIVNVVAKNWDQVTKGTAGLSGIPAATTNKVALIWAVVVITVAYFFQRSRWGLALICAREDEIAAQSVGIRVVALRRLAFSLSAFFAGVGGALFAQLITSFNPNSFYLNLTFLTLAMLVVGGIRSLAGAVVGTIVVTTLSELLRQMEQEVSLGFINVTVPAGLSQVGLAILMIAILAMRPGGITDGKEFRWSAARNLPFTMGGTPAPMASSSAEEPRDGTSGSS